MQARPTGRKTRNLRLPQVRGDPELQDLVVPEKGNRFSITPMGPRHSKRIVKLLDA